LDQQYESHGVFPPSKNAEPLTALMTLSSAPIQRDHSKKLKGAGGCGVGRPKTEERSGLFM
ncbi:MAG TPA: hypothetical protein VMF32_01305, partial [Xanthobacteraceae bacterium]|nr:hypothetical protein [Xanthobacteraceae bacterium]